jgi:hypothetical protein
MVALFDETLTNHENHKEFGYLWFSTMCSLRSLRLKLHFFCDFSLRLRPFLVLRGLI